MSLRVSSGLMRFRVRLWRGVVAVAVVAASLSVVGVTPSAAATTISVSTDTDVAANDGLCSLREAITAANTDTASGAAPGECPAGSGADTIELNAAGPYVLASLLPAIASDLSLNGNGRTVDGANSFRVFEVTSGTVGFTDVTMTDGTATGFGGADRGAGLRVDGAGAVVTVADSTISGNTAGSGGGGIFADAATVTVTDSTISGNTATIGSGGGVGAFSGGTVTVTGSTVSDNTAGLDGGGVYADAATVTVTDSTVSGNTAGLGGGGIGAFSASTVTVTGSTVSGNTAASGGGVGAFSGGTVTVTGSTISGNTASSSGGGINVGSAGTVGVTNSTVSGNTGGVVGGGGIANGATLDLVFSTVTANSALGLGDGVVSFGTDAVTSVAGSIVAGNVGGGDVALIFGSDPFVSAGFNVVGGGNATDAFIAVGDVTGAAAGADPLADNGGPTQTHALLSSSVAVDRVTGVLVPDPGFDQRGVVRPQGVAKDSGAFELAHTLTVSTSTDVVANDGLCSLREAITAANTDTASGAAPGECPAGSGADTIELNAVGPYVLASTLPAIASDLSLNGNGNAVDGAGAFRVFRVSSGVVGFTDITITNGSTTLGGGIDSGGGIFISGGSVVTVIGSTISGNSSILDGGGIHVSSSTVTVTGSTISGNTASVRGGGIAAVFSTVTVTDSTIAGNTAGSGGGGISAVIGSTATVTNSTVSGNTADFGGGISSSNTLDLVFSTVTANTALNSGGGVFSGGASTVAGSIVAGNTGLDDVVLFPGASPFVSGGFNVIGGGNGTGAFTASGDVIGAVAGVEPLANNGGPTETHALQASALAVDRVTGVLVPDPGFDQRGVARPQGVAKDSGAFEREPDVLTVLAMPCAVYDSRTATAPGLGGPLTGAESPRTVQVSGPLTGQGGAGSCVPSDASAVVFTISAVEAVSGGNLRLSAGGVAPNGGVVTFAANGLNNANTVTVALNTSGEVDVKSNVGTTDMRLVAVGFYSNTTGLRFTPLTPCAAVDTRASQGATGAFVGPFPAGAAFGDVDVVGDFPTGQGGDPDELGTTRNCGVPASAEAVVVNLVAVNTTGGTGFLSIGTGGAAPMPEAATPFATLGMNNAATAIVNVTAAGTLAIDIDALTGSPSTQIRVVVSGYLAAAGADYAAVTPCAAFDTRTNQGATGTFEGLRLGGQTTTYQITGDLPTGQGGDPAELAPTRDCGVPDAASAVLVNLVAVNSVEPGNFRAFATGTTPSGGLLNFADLTPAMNNSNAVIIPLSALGQLDLFTNGGPTGVGISITQARGVILGYYN